MTQINENFPTSVSHIRELSPYQSQVSNHLIQLKLDANEGPAWTTTRPMDWSESSFNRYPDCGELAKSVAQLHSVDCDQVLITAGGDESIDRVFRAYTTSGDNLVTTKPTFAMIEKYAAMNGANVRSVAWYNTDFPIRPLIDLACSKTRVVAVVSPNNPTGQTISVSELNQLAQAFTNQILLIDQAYAEFESDEGELTRYALKNIPNAVIVRSLSKAWGLAGIRIGYALGRKEILAELKKVGGPYTVAAPSIAIAQHALQQTPTEHVQNIRRQRKQLNDRFAEWGVQTIESEGNFVLAIFDEHTVGAEFVYRALAAQGILVRYFEELNAIRVTCPGDEQEFELLSAKLGTLLKPKAVLFDMDGVLVDEGPSYRESIRQTCESFGESFTTREIATKKLGGNANNDWVFTQRILAERGTQIEYDEVKERFETIYQGNEETPGLWDREIQLVNKPWLEKLADRYPLGIVTGRPRRDAIRFLQNAGIESLFSVVVCLEDGPAKPDPANVLTAMNKLGVDSAWMIGDTPDDIGAAVSANITALGIIAPEDDRDSTTLRLLKAGASCVVENLEEFGELLP